MENKKLIDYDYINCEKIEYRVANLNIFIMIAIIIFLKTFSNIIYNTNHSIIYDITIPFIMINGLIAFNYYDITRVKGKIHNNFKKLFLEICINTMMSVLIYTLIIITLRLLMSNILESIHLTTAVIEYTMPVIFITITLIVNARKRNSLCVVNAHIAPSTDASKRYLEKIKKGEKDISSIKEMVSKVTKDIDLGLPVSFNNTASNCNSYKYLTLNEKCKYLNALKNNLYISKIEEMIGKLESSRDALSWISSSEYLSADAKHEISTLNNPISFYLNYLTNRKNLFQSEFLSSTLGLMGEAEVNNHINLHTNIVNLYDIRLTDNLGNSIQCDNILITSKGIFILEVKNYGSQGTYSIKVDETGRWTKKSGQFIEVMPSATEQNNRHIAILNNILIENNIDKCPITGIVVISNNEIDLINNSSELIVRPSSIYPTINNIFRENILTADNIKNIETLLKANANKPKKYKLIDLDGEINENLIANITELQEKSGTIAAFVSYKISEARREKLLSKAT